MKSGDLVKLCERNYPQYKGMCGIIFHCHHPALGASDRRSFWKVFINNKRHPYSVCESKIETISESCKQDE